MKRAIFSIFMPLILMQQPTLAQNIEGSVVPLPRTDQVQLQLVNCGGWFVFGYLDCGLSRLFLPEAAFTPVRQLQFDNTTSSALNIMNTAVIAEGTETGYQLTDAASLPQDNLSLPARAIGRLPLKLQLSEIPPDLYTGAIYITPEVDRERFVLPLNISVRSGALVPLSLLILGIFLGQFFKYWQEQGEPQTKALGKVYRLERDVREMPDREDQAILLPMAALVKKLVSQYQLEKADAELGLIHNRLEVLKQLRNFEASCQHREQLLSKDEIETHLETITQARKLIKQGTDATDAEAKDLLDEVRNALGSIKPKGKGEGGGLADENLIDATEAARSASAKLNENRQISSVPIPELTKWESFQQSLVKLSGFSESIQAETNYWVVRPLLWLMLLVGLSTVGMINLYVENGTTFGAKKFTDYFALILWGLSSNVASSSISSLPVLRGQKEIEQSES